MNGCRFTPAGRRAFFHCGRCGEGIPTFLRDAGYLPIEIPCPRKCGCAVALRLVELPDPSKPQRSTFEWISPTVDEWGLWLRAYESLIFEMRRPRLTAFLAEWERWYCGGGLLPRKIESGVPA